jgi:sugar phosphate permease
MNETMMSGNSTPASDEWKDFDFSTVKVEKSRATRALPKREVLRFIVVGFLSGAAVWLVRLGLENWLMQPLFCRTPDTASVCTSSGLTSFIISLVIVGIISSAILASQRVFRAVVISAASFVSLGALWPMLDGRGVLMATAITALFSVGLYLFFSLIAAIKRHALAIILTAALVVAFWLLARS